jgi:transcriptional regulator CtsR
MNISDLIAQFIDETLKESEGVAELRRNILAERFNCVPSQINYVIETRFTPEHGFLVESRRGGGGYIRITRVKLDRANLLMHVINAIGERIDVNSARAFLQSLADANLLSAREGRIILSALSDKTLRSVSAAERDALRAEILKQSLVILD